MIRSDKASSGYAYFLGTKSENIVDRANHLYKLVKRLLLIILKLILLFKFAFFLFNIYQDSP